MNRRALLKSASGAMGASLSAPVLMALTECIEHAPPAAKSAIFETPKSKIVFDDSQREMVSTLADLIIPATDTPGAKAANVPAFIETLVTDHYNESNQIKFMDGLRAMNHHCQVSFGKPFNMCSEAEQTIALEDASENVMGAISDGELGGTSTVPTAAENDWALWGNYPQSGASFFAQLKDMTVLGYYTSEVGATEELIYDPVPGAYDGDADFYATGRHYSA